MENKEIIKKKGRKEEKSRRAEMLRRKGEKDSKRKVELFIAYFMLL